MVRRPAAGNAGKSTVTVPLLSVVNLGIRFGGINALANVNFEAHAGDITSLIGPNGAGKTTAINCITGVYQPHTGAVVFGGRQILGLPAHRLAGLGLTRTFQNIQVFGRMSVLENVMVGMHGVTGSEFLASMLRIPRLKREERRIRERSWEMLEFFGLADRAYKPAEQLPYGDQKKVELARALAGRPRMMLLDEPVAGLNIAETDGIGELIRKIRGQGIGIILVEHDMGLVMRVSDRVVVLSGGRILARGVPHEIQNHPDVIRTYLGGGEEFGAVA